MLVREIILIVLPTSVAGSVVDPHDVRDHRRSPSRGGPPPPTIVEGDEGRPHSEVAHHVPAPPTPGRGTPGPEDVQLVDTLREQHERLNDAERELAQIMHDAYDAEGRRENDFRLNEEGRQQTFNDNEAQRDADARQRTSTLIHELEEKVANVLPTPVPPPRDTDEHSVIESIRTATQDAASRYAADVQEIVRMERELLEKEREANAAERERARADLEAERRHLDEAREARIHELEEELNRVRAELDNERQLRMTEADEARSAAAEREEGLRNQLAEIANLVQQNHACCEENKAASEERWAEKQHWKTERDGQIQELLGIVARIVEEQNAAKQREDDVRQANEGKPSIEQVLEDLARQNGEQRDLLGALSETWRTDNQRQHQELIDAVRATANEQVPYNVQQYLDEFSRALAVEVRMLLSEVGKLREERRSIEHEVGLLIFMRSKYVPGGEFHGDWQPPPLGGGLPPDMPPQPPPDGPPVHEQAPPHIRPGWRPVDPRPTRRIRKQRPPPQPQAEHDIGPSRHTQSWATWQPNPAMRPSPPSVEPTLVVPDHQSPGLFGPRSSRGSLR
ncbi:hypothetical protein EDC04DRAFT_1927411 [Pisolithus marmoratus]|nr:hypothetical protein EDC04DRAFT_1927411 [Pisolithus marmoratus]